MIKFHEVANIFPEMEQDRFDNLKKDIEKNGLIEPIWITQDGLIIDGRHRYRACKELGIEPEFRTYDGADDNLVNFVLSLNLKRRHLDSSQCAMIAVNVEEYVAEQVKEKQREAARHNLENLQRNANGTLRTDDSPLGAILHQAGQEESNQRAPKSTEVAAEVVGGTSARYVAYAKKLKQEEPELAADVLNGKYKIPDANRLAKLGAADREQAEALLDKGKARSVKDAVRKAELSRQADAVERTTLPSDKYHVIVLDPPWAYNKRSNDSTHRAANPYPSMTTDEISEINVQDFAHDNCILWLWCTNAFLREALDLVDEWGFEVKTMLTWVKNRMGLGDWLRGQTEHCLMAIKGRPIVRLTNQTTVLHGNVREHSRKPDEFYEMVEKLCPGRKLELFARQQRTGWDVYGNETDKF